MVLKIHDTEKVAPLFEGWQETMIWSCIQRVMGNIYVDSLEKPASAMALLADFCFFAGKPDAEIVRYWAGPWGQKSASGIIMVPQNREWGELIEYCYGKKAKKTIRYAIKKEPDIFDKQRLQAVVDALPVGYQLRMIDEKLYHQCREISWCRDWVSQYPDYDMYRRLGLGVVALKDEEPVSGASSYTSFSETWLKNPSGARAGISPANGYNGGIEIEIDTRKDYRRKGLAYACGAKLILECLERDWYPSWDAQNTWSVALAEKLGYHFDHEYTVYKVAIAK